MISYNVRIDRQGTEITTNNSYEGFSKCSPLIQSIKSFHIADEKTLNIFLIDFRPEFYKEIILNYKNLPKNSIYRTSSRDVDEIHIANVVKQLILPKENFDYIILDFTWETANSEFINCFLKNLRNSYPHISFSKFIFVTSNSLDDSKKTNYYCDNFFEIYSKEKFIKNQYPIHEITNKEKRFVSLNRKPRPLRLKFVEYLYENNLDQYIYLSHPRFRKYPEKILDSDLNYFDKSVLNSETEKNYIEVVNESLNKEDFFNAINNNLFEKSFWNLVVESVIDTENDMIFITEKTFKCFYGKMPFIIYGSPGILRELKRMNYKTFENFIDERYDDELDPERRLIKIVEEIKKLSSMPYENFVNIYKEITEILEWNFKNFLDRSERKEIGKKLVDHLLNLKYNKEKVEQ